MHLLFRLIGWVLIVSVLWDAFAMIVLPRTVTWYRPSSFFYGGIWMMWCGIARTVGSRGHRQSYLSIFGPFSVILLLGLWALGLIVGFACLHQGWQTPLQVPVGTAIDFWTRLYLSGTTFFTLGIGDVTTLNSLGRSLIVFEAATGFIFLAMIIGYMPLLEQAFEEREVDVLLLESHGGSPQSAVRILRSLHGCDKGEHLEAILRSSEHWVATLLESHTSHPVLCYYRSQHAGINWLVSLTVILDLCAILLASQGEKADYQVKATFRICINTVMALSRALRMAPLRKQYDRLNEEEFETLFGLLARVEIKLSTKTHANDYFNRLRHLYEPYVMAMAQRLWITLPRWVPHDHDEQLWPNYLEKIEPGI